MQLHLIFRGLFFALIFNLNFLGLGCTEFCLPPKLSLLKPTLILSFLHLTMAETQKIAYLHIFTFIVMVDLPETAFSFYNIFCHDSLVLKISSCFRLYFNVIHFFFSSHQFNSCRFLLILPVSSVRAFVG